MDKLFKIWKETAFIELCSFFIDLLEFCLWMIAKLIEYYAEYCAAFSV